MIRKHSVVDFLIIGHGLAGSILAWELKQRGCKIVIVDNDVTSASQIAAGLINPITGMRLVKTQDVDILLSSAKHCYQNLSRYFQQSFFIEKPMLRIIGNQQELQYSFKRLSDSSYHQYLDDYTPAPIKEGYSAPFGILKQRQTGYLKTRELLSALKKYFQISNSYIESQVCYEDIKLNKTYIQWKNIEAKKVIFCEGYLGQANPWFSWLPFQLVKGEILTMTSVDDLPKQLINYGFWLLPTGNKTFRTGATFDRDRINTETTQEAKATLLEALKKIVPELIAERMIAHQAHIRPATADKRPFIGCHPEQPLTGIFNGFGAKGSLQIPWYAQRFVDHLLTGKILPVGADINRYF